MTARERHALVEHIGYDETPIKGGKPAKSLVFRRADWYIPNRDGDGFLNGIKCGMCGLGFRTGQSVWAQSISTGANYYGRTRTIVAWHSGCMREKLDRAPAEKYDEIRDRLSKGGGLFD